MHFTTSASTIALVGLLGQAATAAYTVTLYPKAGCKYNNALLKTGAYRCPRIGANHCCSGGTQYQAAKFREEGTSGNAGCDDELKVYSAFGREECGLPTAQGAHGSCVSSGQAIAGAKVVVVINPGGGSGGSGGGWSGRRRRGLGQQQPVTVAPSQYIFENGTETHVLDLDSDHGRALQLLTRDEDKVEYVLQYGTVEPTDDGLQKRACRGATPAAGAAGQKPPAKAAGNQAQPRPANNRAPAQRAGRV